MTRPEPLFRRDATNPILSAADVPYPANSVFNPAAARVDGETILLVRVEDLRGISQLHVARSQDGVTDWQFDAKPLLQADVDRDPEETWGCEDPRVTWLPEREEWAIAYTAYSRRGPLVGLATTRDFRSVRRLGPVMPPEDKDAALFPRRFDGRWAMIHRPSPLRGGAHMWLSYSPDLRHWGDHKLLLEARDGAWWDAGKIGLGPPPLETPQGWLVMYHGVRVTSDGPIYRVGLALLDLDDPGKLLHRTDSGSSVPRRPTRSRAMSVVSSSRAAGSTMSKATDSTCTTAPRTASSRLRRPRSARSWTRSVPRRALRHEGPPADGASAGTASPRTWRDRLRGMKRPNPLQHAMDRFTADPASVRNAAYVMIIITVGIVLIGGVIVWVFDRRDFPDLGGALGTRCRRSPRLATATRFQRGDRATGWSGGDGRRCRLIAILTASITSTFVEAAQRRHRAGVEAQERDSAEALRQQLVEVLARLAAIEAALGPPARAPMRRSRPWRFIDDAWRAVAGR